MRDVDKIKLFEDMVAGHDLTFAFSDDHRAWQKGNAERHKIMQMKKEIPYKRAVEIWNKYVDQKIAEDSRRMFYWGQE